MGSFAACDVDSNGTAHFGLCFRAADGKLIALAIYTKDAEVSPRLLIYRLTSPTASTSNYRDRRNALCIGHYVWLKIEDDGTRNLKFYFGDGWNRIEFFSVSRVDFMASGPSQVGFYVANPDHKLESLIRLCHFNFESTKRKSPWLKAEGFFMRLSRKNRLCRDKRGPIPPRSN